MVQDVALDFLGMLTGFSLTVGLLLLFARQKRGRDGDVEQEDGPMKILQINSVCGVGSTGRIAADLHASLTENRMDSRIAYGRGEALAETRRPDQDGLGQLPARRQNTAA